MTRPVPVGGTVLGMSSSAATPLLFLLLVLATDVWIYSDAKARSELGRPVVVTFRSFEVDTPMSWFLASLLLWIVVVPLYLTARKAG